MRSLLSFIVVFLLTLAIVHSFDYNYYGEKGKIREEPPLSLYRWGYHHPSLGTIHWSLIRITRYELEMKNAITGSHSYSISLWIEREREWFHCRISSIRRNGQEKSRNGNEKCRTSGESCWWDQFILMSLISSNDSWQVSSISSNLHSERDLVHIHSIPICKKEKEGRSEDLSHTQ